MWGIDANVPPPSSVDSRISGSQSIQPGLGCDTFDRLRLFFARPYAAGTSKPISNGKRIVMLSRSGSGPDNGGQRAVFAYHYQAALASCSMASNLSGTSLKDPFLILGGSPLAKMSSFSTGSARRYISVLWML